MPADLRRWVTQHLPDLRTVEDVSWCRIDSQVWRVACPTATAYVKISPARRNYTREVRAYQHAAGALGPGRAPRLLAVNPGLRAIMTSPLAGVVVRTTDLAAAEETRVHELAGQLLRRWQAHDRGPIGPATRAAAVTSIQTRTDVAAQQAERTAELLTAPELALVGHALRELPALAATVPLAFAHGDFSPRNWIWNRPTASLALLDFEKADNTIAVEDFLWLAATTWPLRPHLRQAMLTGFGRDLDDDETRALTLLTALAALSYLAAGATRQDPVLTTRAHNAFTHLIPPASTSIDPSCRPA